MAGIGFELRKLFREEGLSNTVKAYSFSAVTTIGPMILCMFLIIVLQRMMSINNGTYLDWELYIATVQYCFIFSIIITSGISMVLTRFISDMIYEKKYDRLLSSYYGALMICLPLGALTVWLFLPHISASISYKVVTYLFFMELIVIWVQAVYLSALKDYTRIVRSFSIGVVVSLLSGWLLLSYTNINATTAAILAIDIGFFVIAITSAYHFEQVFSARKSRLYFEFLAYFKKFPSLFFVGTFFYAGIYIHSFVYWFIGRDTFVADGYWISPFYDLPVFYAFISVIPTLVTFVVSVETAFYEKFRLYYKRVIEGGTYQEMERAKKEMQRTLMNEFSFLMEVQLLFTIISIAIGMKLLPGIGFTMAQLDAFNLLVLGYFLFIMMFVLLHLLLYFDDRKGVLYISSSFVVMNAALTYWTMQGGSDGLGMFIASLLAFIAATARLMYVLRNIDYFTFCRQPLSSMTTKTTTRVPGKWRKPMSVVSTLMILTVVLSACTSSAGDVSPVEDTTSKEVTSSTTPEGLSEDKRIYEKDEDGSIKELYVTVLPGKSREDGQLDWYGLNRVTQRADEGSLKVIMQEGDTDGTGPAQGLFGYGQSAANAKISLRGSSTRYASQKSYKIQLTDEAGLWNNQRTINLSKHSFDLSRVRNKLSFDLFENIPNFTSLRTQFVHLYVKDQSEGASNGQYVDYGLYTQVEQPNKAFLKSHWLDPYGQLYKVAFFEFARYPDQIKSQSDPTYDKAQFETILEIKGREDHDKLIAMLDDVNNMSMPIDEVMEKHFDLDNYLTWMAINILTDNMDTGANNLYIYSPLNSDKWYFLPWDYDGGWEWNGRQMSDYQDGISNYWGSVLPNRYFRSEAHVNLLQEKIEEMSQYINKDTVTKQLDIYQQQVEPFLTRSPDLDYLPGKASTIASEFKNIAEVPEKSIQRFLNDLERPKPFFLGDVDGSNSEQMLEWGLSYDLQGDDLLYDVTIALDPAFRQVVQEVKDIASTTVTVKGLKKNTYYWKVIVRDSNGHEQIAFDTFEDDDGYSYYGVREFEVY